MEPVVFQEMARTHLVSAFLIKAQAREKVSETFALDFELLDGFIIFVTAEDSGQAIHRGEPLPDFTDLGRCAALSGVNEFWQVMGESRF
jgi:hypothetical protein